MKDEKTIEVYDPTDFYVDHRFMMGVCKAVVNDINGIKEAMREQSAFYGNLFWHRVLNLADVKYLEDEMEWHAQENATMAGFCRYAHHMLSVHCEQRDLLKIKNLVPKWSEIHNRWGWNVIYDK
ncbi:hypothetical protein ABIB38_004775 [Massilia sp. UYP11]|uniref:hypothetical protein n=1 Tax=Massilia sp. UYP11 TaxID=1756385 RepID=UPI003D1CF4A9